MTRRKKKNRFLATSKLIGLLSGFILIGIVIFSMVMVAITKDLSPLSFLLTGAFGIVATYIGFYINMAKTEHIEEVRTQIKKQLEEIPNRGIIEEAEVQLNQLDAQLEELEQQECEVKTF